MRLFDRGGARRAQDRFAQLFRTAPGARNGPLSLSVREAWLAHERYAGRQVALMGVVRAFEAGTASEYFVLDDGPNRVGLRGDVALLRLHSGQAIRAVGLLVFKPGEGIFLLANEVRPV